MHPDLVRADRFDRLVEVDVAPIDRDARLRLDRFRDVGGRDGSEEPSFLAGASLDGEP